MSRAGWGWAGLGEARLGEAGQGITGVASGSIETKQKPLRYRQDDTQRQRRTVRVWT